MATREQLLALTKEELVELLQLSLRGQEEATKNAHTVAQLLAQSQGQATALRADNDELKARLAVLQAMP